MADAEPYMLTTVDNPYNPFTQWDEWYAYDWQAHYYSSELLARVVITSDELSESDERQAIEHAIDEIVQEDVLGLYRSVKPSDNMQEQAAVATAKLAERSAA